MDLQLAVAELEPAELGSWPTLRAGDRVLGKGLNGHATVVVGRNSNMNVFVRIGVGALFNRMFAVFGLAAIQQTIVTLKNTPM